MVFVIPVQDHDGKCVDLSGVAVERDSELLGVYSRGIFADFMRTFIVLL